MKVTPYFSKGRKFSSDYCPTDISFQEYVIHSHYDQSEILFTAPTNWSTLAVEIVANKYRYKGQLKNSPKGETNLKQIIYRLIHCWSSWGIQLEIISEDQSDLFKKELAVMLYDQIAAPNSPQWFNSGLFSVYGIEGDGHGHFFVDDNGDIVETKNSYERPQPHACFIQSVEDKLVGRGSIMNLWEREARLFKFGSGTGTNFSNLRAKDEPLSQGGVSSGVMQWLKIGDRAAGAIKSGGTTRRAAKMVCLDIDHPEIEDFILWKADEEEKLLALVLGHKKLKKEKRGDHFKYYQGIDEIDFDWMGIGYDSISGQNANNSVRVTNKFLKAVKENKKWPLISRLDNSIIRKVDARKLWHLLCECAWKCADPGIQFHDTINNWHTCPNEGEIRASNPCSEYMFLDDTACNLASLNALKFYDGKSFDYSAFLHACHLWTLVLEISVGMAQYPSREIAKNSHDYRTLGLGLTNLGALFMNMGLPYDSDEAREVAGRLCGLLTGQAYLTSSQLAEEHGPFEKFENNKAEMLNVLNLHFDAWKKLDGDQTVREIGNDLWSTLLNRANKFGLRNAQVSAIAPTGTISLVMDCDTTGIEPEYSFVKSKKLASGESVQIVNNSLIKALKKLGYSKEQSLKIEKYILEKNKVTGAPDLKETRVFQCAVTNEGEEEDIVSPSGHLMMMSVAQPFISGAISKTLNLPYETPVSVVSEVFLRAHKLGLKSLAIYRDGSKLSQPLKSVKTASPFKCSICDNDQMILQGSCWQCTRCGESSACS